MHGAVIAERFGELVPLAAATHAEQDAIERTPPVGALTAGAFGWRIVEEDRFDELPQGIGDFPDGIQRLRLRHGHDQNQLRTGAELDASDLKKDSVIKIVS